MKRGKLQACFAENSARIPHISGVITADYQGGDRSVMKSTLSITACGRIAAIVLISFAGGILNGLVGSGSGIVFLFLWNLLAPAGSDAKARYSFAMSCVLIVSVVSLFLYPSEAATSLPLPTLIAAVVAGILGGAGGALLKDKVKTSWLNRAFALLTLYSGLSMVLRR